MTQMHERLSFAAAYDQDGSFVFDPKAQVADLIDVSRKLVEHYPDAALSLEAGDGNNGIVRPARSVLALTSRDSGEQTFISATCPIDDPSKVETLSVTTTLFKEGRWSGLLAVRASMNAGFQYPHGEHLRVERLGDMTHQKDGPEKIRRFEERDALALGWLANQRLTNMLEDGAPYAVSLRQTRNAARKRHIPGFS